MMEGKSKSNMELESLLIALVFVKRWPSWETLEALVQLPHYTFPLSTILLSTVIKLQGCE